MSLSMGHKLGHYELLEPIGKGGMGEVYRARDKKLDREVAVKVLPEGFAADPERLARFEREAKLLASLNHPNIAAIHGFQESEGVNALVLELVEGPTLAERIAEGPIPVDEAIAIAKQIAEALEAGHEAGVIHRDLKPANIKLKEDGTVKVLDYGLAKALEGDAASGADSELSQSPTLTRQGTQVGVILGTAAYMSPEQAKGKRVDRRTDIWAFGAVVYEMLTGQRAFAGNDVSEVLASVIAREPDWNRLPKGLSPVLDTYLRRCLHKDPKERIRDIGDLRLALQGAFDANPLPKADAVLPAPPAAWRRALPVVGALVVGLLTAGLSVWALLGPDTSNVARFDVTPPDDDSTILSNSPSVVIAPDGRSFAYLSGGDAGSGGALHLRSLNHLEATTLVADEKVASPFFSPDGSQIGFYDNGPTPKLLKRVSLQGGPASTITEIPGGGPLRGASWGADGTIIFAESDPTSGLWRVPAAGGEPELLTTPSEADGESDHFWPEILPGGDAVLFGIIGASEEESKIAVLSLVTGEQHVLVRGGSYGRYSPTGHLLYGLAGTLWAVPLDLDRLETRGGPIPVQERVLTKGRLGATEVSLSTNGTLLYAAGAAQSSSERGLVWVDATGREESALTPAGDFDTVALSPDGTRAALGTSPDRESADIWISDLTRGTLERLTRNAGVNRNPLWSPDGRRVAYGSTRNGRPEVVWQSADGTGAVESLAAFEPPVIAVIPTSWSPDGSMLTLAVLGSGEDIGVVTVGEPESFRLLGSEEVAEHSPSISPDGRWFAYSSRETGIFEVYVQRFPDGGGRQAVSIGGGYYPKWSADGEILAYLRNDGGAPLAAMRVTVTPGETPEDSLVVSVPEELFPWTYYHRRRSHAFFDMVPDGERFLVIAGTEGGTGTARTILVQNWFEELNRLVPTE